MDVKGCLSFKRLFEEQARFNPFDTSLSLRPAIETSIKIGWNPTPLPQNSCSVGDSKPTFLRIGCYGKSRKLGRCIHHVDNHTVDGYDAENNTV